MDDPRDTGGEEPAGETADDTAEFSVDFPEPSVFDQKLRPNPFGLIGEGSIAITRDGIILTGNRHAPYPSGTAVIEVASRQIVDVVRDGWQLSMTILPADADAKPGTLVMRALDKSEAIAISSRLPLDLSPDRAREVAEQREFSDQLDRLEPRTPATWTLLIVNLAIFVAMAMDGAGLVKVDTMVHFRWGSNFGPSTLYGQWWRLLSSNYLHFGLSHLAVNMWALFSSGRLVERLYGSVRFLAIYMLAGITGELAGLYGNAQIHSVGASGSILGVLGALLAFMLRPGNRLPKSTLRGLLPSTLVFVTSSVTSGFFREGINNAAHIGGLLAGFGAGWVLAVPLDEEGRRRDYRRLGWVLGGAALGFVVAALPLHFQHGVRVQRQEATLRSIQEESGRVDANWKSWALGEDEGRWEPDQSAAVLESTVIRPLERMRLRMLAHMRDLGVDSTLRNRRVIEYLEGYQADLSQVANARRMSDTLAMAAALRAIAANMAVFDSQVIKPER